MNWKDKLGHYSTWALTAVASIPAIWLSVPEEVKVVLPPKVLVGVTALVGVAGLIGKFIPQDKKVKPE